MHTSMFPYWYSRPELFAAKFTSQSNSINMGLNMFDPWFQIPRDGPMHGWAVQQLHHQGVEPDRQWGTHTGEEPQYLIPKIFQGENIADNGGVKVAYEAWKLKFGSEPSLPLPSLSLTPSQLFWVCNNSFCAPGDTMCAVEHQNTIKNKHIFLRFPLRSIDAASTSPFLNMTRQ